MHSAIKAVDAPLVKGPVDHRNSGRFERKTRNRLESALADVKSVEKGLRNRSLSLNVSSNGIKCIEAATIRN